MHFVYVLWSSRPVKWNKVHSLHLTYLTVELLVSIIRSEPFGRSSPEKIPIFVINRWEMLWGICTGSNSMNASLRIKRKPKCIVVIKLQTHFLFRLSGSNLTSRAWKHSLIRVGIQYSKLLSYGQCCMYLTTYQTPNSGNGRFCGRRVLVSAAFAGPKSYFSQNSGHGKGRVR